MALEYLNEQLVSLVPGPMDPHTHPRITDPLTPDDFLPANAGQEGKAGLSEYSFVALQSGITVALAMPNEQMRRFAPSHEHPHGTEIIPYPIDRMDRVLPMQSAISHESVIPMGLILGNDPERMYVDKRKETLDIDWIDQQYLEAGAECMALKTYGAETTGGFNVNKRDIPVLAERWYRAHPEKPHVMHLEDGDVREVLRAIAQLPNGKEFPIHIAHVSSRQELEAVIEAKQAGMNITCEVTPHHLTQDSTARDEIGNYGCMKPTLKTQEDIDFIWANIDWVDMFASDCAPHRVSDKESPTVTYGVANHIEMLPILLGAVTQGKITMPQLFQKLCIAPRERFNLPTQDNSEVHAELSPTSPQQLHDTIAPRYGQSPFTRLNRAFGLVGHVSYVRTGMSEIRYASSVYIGYNRGVVRRGAHTSYAHLITPAILEAQQSL
jgi:hypothetical protein